jgi:hypothetical protein
MFVTLRAPAEKNRCILPALVAVGAAAAAAILVVLVALSARDGSEPEAGPPGPLNILGVVAVDDTVVRVVTSEGGCRRPVFADLRMRAGAVELRVIGQDPGGGCTADMKIRCNKVRLPAGGEGKPLVAVPVAESASRLSDKAGAREYAADPCPRLQPR